MQFDVPEDQGQNMNVNQRKDEIKKRVKPLYGTKTFLAGILLTYLK